MATLQNVTNEREEVGGEGGEGRGRGRGRERAPELELVGALDFMKPQRHCRGHSEQSAYVCSTVVKILQGTASTGSWPLLKQL